MVSFDKSNTTTRKNLVLAIAALALTVAAAFGAEGDFEFDAATGTITRYSGWDTEMVIPAAIGGKKVTAIGEEAFKGADLTGVTLPEGLVTIGEDSFWKNNLTSITIPPPRQRQNHRSLCIPGKPADQRGHSRRGQGVGEWAFYRNKLKRSGLTKK